MIFRDQNLIESVTAFRVMTYNILSPNYVIHGKHDKKFKNWKKRSTQILKEIDVYRPEILLLQECEMLDYNTFFKVKKKTKKKQKLIFLF